MSAVPTTNDEVIATFRANGGAVPAPYDDPPPMVLLHTVGRRSGREHVVPMRGLVDADAVYVFATAHGSDRDPDWYRNLVATPDIVIELGSATIPVRATTLAGVERERMLARWLARVPLVAPAFARATRVVPVVRLAFPDRS
jgi:deazaflavin-dependent oxidoreductase (nitroreductase family)